MANSWSTRNNDVVIGVVGVTGSGKSSFIKRVTQCADIVVGEGLESVTQAIAQYKIQHKGVQYTLVDTPGFDDSVREDEDVFHELAEWMEKSYRAGQRLSGLIYLHPIISTRERGSEIRNLRMFKKVCGDNNFSNVILGLTFCDLEERAVIARRQRQLIETPEWWGDMVANGSRVEHLSLEPDACLDLLSRFAPTRQYGGHQNKMTLQIQTEIVDFGLSVDDTEAAQVIVYKRELEAIREREKRELSQLHADFEARMTAASIRYRQQMHVVMQKHESVRKRQQAFEHTLRLQEQLQEELERKARLALEEERSKEESQANEMKRLEELLQRTRIANAEAEKRIKIQNERAQLLARIMKRSKTFQLEWGLLEDWQKLGKNTQNHMTWGRTDGSGEDPTREFMGAFCDGCLKSFRSSEQIYRCTSCTQNGGSGLPGELASLSVWFCNGCKAAGKSCLIPGHSGFASAANYKFHTLEQCRYTWGKVSYCNSCRDVLGGLFLHCCSCDSDHYELCVPCWGKGATCRNTQHKLDIVSRCPPALLG